MRHTKIVGMDPWDEFLLGNGLDFIYGSHDHIQGHVMASLMNHLQIVYIMGMLSVFAERKFLDGHHNNTKNMICYKKVLCL